MKRICNLEGCEAEVRGHPNANYCCREHCHEARKARERNYYHQGKVKVQVQELDLGAPIPPEQRQLGYAERIRQIPF